MPIYIDCVILIILYTVFRIFVLGETLVIKDIIQSFLWGKTVIIYGWYLQTILLLYVAFWIILSLIKNEKTVRYLILKFLLIYAIICYLSGIKTTWYEGVLPFWFGMVWYANQNKINRWMSSKYYLKLFGCAICFLALFLLGISSKYGNAQIVFKMLEMLIFALLFMMLLYRISIANKVTHFFGKYTLEIYVVQGAVFSFFHSRVVNISNHFLYGLVTIPVIILAAIGISMIFHKTRKLLND